MKEMEIYNLLFQSIHIEMFPTSKKFFKLSIGNTARKGAFTEVELEQEENKSGITDQRIPRTLCLI